MYVRQLTVSYRLRRLRRNRLTTERLAATPGCARVFAQILGHEIVEVFGMLCLSSKLDIVAYHEVSRGTIDSALVMPRDVFRTALLAHAASVVVAHNHPSGDVTPSPEDMALTLRLKDAGDLVGVPLADHLIVTLGTRYYSFRESMRL